MHIPPPIHGSSIVGNYLKNSKWINNNFDTDFINLSTSSSLKEIGKFSTFKIKIFIKILFQALVKNLRKKYDICYIAIAINGKAFYRDLLIVILLKLLRKKIILHLHNKGVSKFKNIFRKMGYRIVFNNTYVILLSELLYSDIEKYVKKENTFICNNGIQLNSYSKPVNKLVTNKINLLFLSNMMIKKGVFVLLDACKELVKINKEFVCNFVGGWKDITEKEFYNYLFFHKIDNNIKYYGPKYGEDKIDHLKSADIFIHPTLDDCFPLNLIEAMQYNIPIVSTKEGGIPDIVIDGVTGFLCKKNDPEDLAKKISLLIKNLDLRKKMGDAGRKRYEEKFTLKHFENRMVEILQSIANE